MDPESLIVIPPRQQQRNMPFIHLSQPFGDIPFVPVYDLQCGIRLCFAAGKQDERCFADARDGYGVKMTDDIDEESQRKYDEDSACTNLDLSNDVV